MRRAWLAQCLATASLLLSASVHAQDRILVGRVIEARQQQPVADAQVVVLGTAPTLGARTDIQGQFRIAGLGDSAVTIRVSAIGFLPVTRRAVPADTGIVVALTPVAVSLDQVVVTGTPGATRTREIGNSISTIDASTVVASAPGANLTQLLGGRVSGVNLISNSGSAGAGGKIQIRGTSSLSLSNGPLVYIDGVRIDNTATSGSSSTVNGVISRINDIHPEEIASIEVIKGPAAATLYGTEASNGVIQIITKRGAAGPVNVDLSMRYGTQWFADAEDRVGLVYGRNASGQILSTNIVESENARGTPIFGKGRIQSYTIGVGGGSPTVRAHLTSALEQDDGVFSSNALRRLSHRANVSVAVSKNVVADVTLGYLSGRTKQSQEQSIMWDLLYGSPLNVNTRGFVRAPPEAYHAAFTTFQDVSRTVAGAYVRHQPLSWLQQQFRVGVDNVSEQNQQIVPRLTGQNYFGVTGLGFKAHRQRTANNNTYEYTVLAERDIRPALNSKSSAGLQYYRKSVQFLGATGNEFPAPGVTTVSSAARITGSESLVDNSTVGLFVQQQLGWKDRLFVTGALRADDNSAFGKNYKVVYYPKASVAWVASEEPFWKVPGVDQLRFRAALGASGRQPDAFAAVQAWTPQTGPGNTPIVLPAFRGNPDLKPERGEELEAGFEAGLFRNFASLDFTYYNKRTKDAIMLRTLAPSMGFSQPQYVNIGEVRNHGIEALLTVRPLETPATALELGLNISTNTNKIVSMGGLPPILFNQDFVQRNQEGYPIGAFFERRIVSADLDATGNPINVMCDGGPDANNAPVACATAPRVYLGKPDPSLLGALTSRLRLFTRLELSALADFKRGHRVFNVDQWLACTVFRNCEINFYPQNFDPKQVAAVRLGYHPDEIQSGDFLALREVAATYTLPERWAARARVDRASITLAGRNVHKWTSYRGLDPEVGRSFYGTDLDWLNYALVPQLAQISTTIRLGF